MNRVVHLGIQMTHPGLILDGHEDVLDWELQRGEAVRYLVGSGFILLRVQGWLLLKSSLRTTLDVNGGASMPWLQFCPIVIAVERLIGRAFHYLLQLDVWLGLYRISL